MKLNYREKLVIGVGINDADYNVGKHVTLEDGKKVLIVCPFYARWRDMLSRCYSEKVQEKSPSYVGCSVAHEWLTFSKFKSWMEQQDWEGKQIDKDLLVPNNKVYGPNTCVFITPKVNTFIRDTTRGDWPIGVTYHKLAKRLFARCRDVITGENKNLGCYDTPEEAHQAWLTFKLEQAYILAAEQTDERVAKALIDKYENYHS